MKKTIFLSFALLMSVNSFGNQYNKANVRLINETSNYYKKEPETIKDKFSELNKETIEKLQVKKIVSGKQDAIKRVSTTFNFFPDSIYDVFVTPDFLTMIKLEEDENIITIKSGDTTNFEIEQEFGGEDNSVYLFVTATDLNVTGNLAIMTDKRIYMLNLYSTLEMFNPIVKFNYPNKDNIMTVKTKNNSQSYNNPKKVSVKAVEDLDVDYVVSNKNLPFSPIAVYSDGVKTVIVLPSDIQEVPVVLAKGENSNTYEVVNYDYELNKIIIHRHVKEAVLKVGHGANSKQLTIKHK